MRLMVGFCQWPWQGFSGEKAPVGFSSLTENSALKPSTIHHQTDFPHLFGKGTNHRGASWASDAASGLVGTADSPPSEEAGVLFLPQAANPSRCSFLAQWRGQGASALRSVSQEGDGARRNGLGAVLLTEGGSEWAGRQSWILKQNISFSLKPELLSFGTGVKIHFRGEKKKCEGVFLLFYLFNAFQTIQPVFRICFISPQWRCWHFWLDL